MKNIYIVHFISPRYFSSASKALQAAWASAHANRPFDSAGMARYVKQGLKAITLDGYIRPPGDSPFPLITTASVE